MDNNEIQYRGATLTEMDQDKKEAVKEAIAEEVTHVQYRGAEDDVKINKKTEKHLEHVQYRGAEDDKMV